MFKLRLISLVAVLIVFLASPAKAEPERSEAPRVDRVRLEIRLASGSKARITTLLGERAMIPGPNGAQVKVLAQRLDGDELSLQIFKSSPETSSETVPEEVLVLHPGESKISESADFEIRWSDAPPARTERLAAKAAAGPLPDLIFRGELLLPSGRTARFAVRAGEVLSVTLADGRRLGFVPVIEDPAAAEIAFRVVPLGLAKVNPAIELQPLETLLLVPGEGRTVSSVAGAFLKLSKIELGGVAQHSFDFNAKEGRGQAVSDELIQLQSGICCCGAGSERVCGCAVDTDTCFCCVGGCCGGAPRY